MNLSEVKALAEAVRGEIAKAVVGQDEAVDLLLTALFCGGHVLLEGPPGASPGSSACWRPQGRG